ncbi:alpha/beta hydrolase [Archangium lansingense]|uniref:Alpha/beta fold hydrolase n=1 Tax=Archangium lansingense TaxID=2995310 RepID=A0ABT4A3V0_9BACT|nr:alpha/beta fold hydrolase [Archangium lansinium]MCY1075622.1 alpha/beta fold hydrolase [Archangium lansinium]
MKKMIRLMGAWMALVLALALPATAEATGPRDVKVERREFPVRLANGQRYTVVGYLYYQGSLKNRPVQILSHGITYNHGYWDLPEIDGRDYSYARYMARRNYAVLALDLPGAGESERLDGDALNLAESASALHQVARHLRATAQKNTFEQLIYVGHSNGALISTFAQALYGDAQAVVNTGWLNAPHTVPVDSSVLLEFLNQGPYITVPGEMRGALFYDPAHSNPELVAYDNETADTVTRGQYGDLLTMMAYPQLIPAGDIRVPVMVQLGDNDLLAPASYAAAEARMYPRSCLVWVDTLNNTGHVFNGHYGKERGWAAIDLWLSLVVR